MTRRHHKRNEPRVLVIVQNMPVPQDRRVWLECRALHEAGYEVSVICPKGPDEPSRQTLDGVHLYKYRAAPSTTNLLSFVYEFVYCWIRTAALSVVVWRRDGFTVLQACNPPDTYWLLARLWKMRGVRFVYDQHDLNPELFISRFGEPLTISRKLEYRGLLWLERMTYQTADHVIATNESYKRIAVTRGSRDSSDVTVVRSGPDTSRMRPVRPSRSVCRGGEHLLVYLGIMGPQDNVEVILDVMHELVHHRGRSGVRAALLGYGDCLASLRQRCTELGLDEVVEFTGRADTAMIADYLSSADVGLSPDLKTPLNDVSTMNKTMEYMAYCLPSVSFDLRETRVSAGETALYVESGDVAAFADAIETLLEDADLRVRLGLAARARVETHLDWSQQATRYLQVFGALLDAPLTTSSDRDGVCSRSTAQARPGAEETPYVDLSVNAIHPYLRHRWRRAETPAPQLNASSRAIKPTPDIGSDSIGRSTAAEEQGWSLRSLIRSKGGRGPLDVADGT